MLGNQDDSLGRLLIMIDRKEGRQRRRGVATVEMALVSILLFLFLFGIFEYCRLLFTLHVAQNAAHDAARFAAVHTGGGTMAGDPATFASTDIVNIATTGQTQGITYGSGMCGMQGNLQNFTVNVFTVDPVALAQTPAVVQALAGSQWNSAAFDGNIAVQITGNYQPVMPSLLFMGSSIPVTVTVMFSSEGN
jgi:Flp pilus assembly protein TadG